MKITPINLNRRSAMLGLAATGSGLLAGSAVADRGMLQSGRTTACHAGGVATSDITKRVALLSDFSGESMCRMTPDSVEGPYFICTDTMSQRLITEDRDGTPLTIALRVVDASCMPIAGAVVDVWQCDARGNYSGHNVDPDNPGRGGRNRREPDLPSRFLRGVLATDVDGVAEFDAIYPGYYGGRAIHTHFKVHVGQQVFLTSQAVYPEDWNAKIMAQKLYSDGRLTKRVSNATDRFAANMFTVHTRGDHLLATQTLAVPA